MAIAYDVSASTFSAANVSSLTTGAVTASGSDRYLVAGAASGAGTAVGADSMKWGGSGGTALTQHGSSLAVGPNGHISAWSLDDPATGSQTLYGSWPSNQDETCIGGNTYTGVQGVRGTASAAGNQGVEGQPTVNVTTVASDMAVDFLWLVDGGGNNPTIAVGSGQTSRIEIEAGAITQYEAFGSSEESATGSSTTMSWTISLATAADWGIWAIALTPASGDTLMSQILT